MMMRVKTKGESKNKKNENKANVKMEKRIAGKDKKNNKKGSEGKSTEGE